MNRPWDWEASDMSLLWRFHLHYFDYLFLLEPEARSELCIEWIEENPVGRGVGWHPYPISIRVVNWCKLYPRFAPRRILKSLYRQTGYLARDLETYLSGNHLLENARALVVAGLYFDESGEASRWLDTGLKIFHRELPLQILSDGGHYERSPMYHARVVEACLDVLNLLPSRHESRPLLSETVAQMLQFLLSLRHPDGRISLLNDATYDGAPSPDRLRSYATDVQDGSVEEVDSEEEPLAAFPATGYYRYICPPFVLVLDAGPIGPAHQPAHGHADVFSYELSVGGRRFVTDSGVYEYQAGEMREYCRSTRAHSTVEVDGVDQVEVWGSFRVGRRFAPRVTEAAADDGSFRLEASFDGYRELIGDGILHRRRFALEADVQRFRVEDRVDGRGRHLVLSRIHLHPEVEIEKLTEGFRLRRADTTLTLSVSGETLLERGWYCPEFGVRHERSVLRIGSEVELPTTLTYEFRVS